jgi:hypothetical protein
MEEDPDGTVLMAATLTEAPREGATVRKILRSSSGYALAESTYQALQGKLAPARTGGDAPKLPGGDEVPVGQSRAVVSQTVEGGDGQSSSSQGSEGGSSDSSQSAQDSSIMVSVTVDATSVGAGSSSARVQLAPGSSALDALRATGVSIGSRGYGGGTWVTSIGGVAEDGTHGWTYTVDGSMPSSMSDQYTVHDGTSVVWRYVKSS